MDRDWHGDYMQCIQCGWYKDTSGDPLEGLVASAMATLTAQMAGEVTIPTLRERLAREKAS